MLGENRTRAFRRLLRVGILSAAAMLVVFCAPADADKVIVLPDEQSPREEAVAPEGQVERDRARYVVETSLQKGTEFLRQGRYAEAKAEMERVLAADAENAQARAILAKADAELAELAAVPTRPATDETARENHLEMEYRYYQANCLIAEGRYQEAIPKLEMAIAIGRSMEDTGALLADATALLENARGRQNASTSGEAAADRKRAHEVVLAYEQKQRALEREKARTLFERAKKYYGDREFADALECISGVLQINEDYPGAGFLKEKIETDGKEAIARARAEEKRRSHEAEIARTYQDAIPQNRLLVYPQEPRRHDVPQIGTAEPEPTGPAMEAIEAALQRKVSCDFNGAPLIDAVGYLRKSTGCNMVVDPRCACKNDPIGGLSVADKEMVHVLNMVCRMNRLKWAVKDEMIIISDRALSEEKVMRVYDISDLLVAPKSFQAGSYHSVSRYGDLPVAGRSKGQAAGSEESIEERTARGRQMVDLIRGIVAPETWGEDDGRGQHTIHYRGGKLVIKNSEEVHDKIVRLLDAFRKARAVQVSILARFIELNKDYLERVGIDWTGLDNLVTRGISGETQRSQGANLPAGGAYQGSNRLDEFGNPIILAPWYRNDEQDPLFPLFGPTRGTPDESGAFTTAETFGRRPWPPVLAGGERPGGALDLRGRNVNIMPLTMPSLAQGWTDAGGLFLDIAFLSRYQVRALIEAVKKRRQGNLLTSPRVTCFNGQRANIVVATLYNYIQTYDETGTPTISSATDGVVLEVKPYVSADQHYVTLELLPSISEVSFPDAPIYVERAFITPDDVYSEGVIPIETPEIAVRSVETTVSVPDGGTILIGGLSEATEREGYASVPLLSKIPIIKYLFMSWGRLDTRNSLVILVTANILIQTELEPEIAASE